MRFGAVDFSFRKNVSKKIWTKGKTHGREHLFVSKFLFGQSVESRSITGFRDRAEYRRGGEKRQKQNKKYFNCKLHDCKSNGYTEKSNRITGKLKKF